MATPHIIDGTRPVIAMTDVPVEDASGGGEFAAQMVASARFSVSRISAAHCTLSRRAKKPSRIMFTMSRKK
jgi:hypothetical protein